jgi:hypothetical protein
MKTQYLQTYRTRREYCLPISTGAGQHFVDSDDVEGMNANSHVESILSSRLRNILVGADSCGFKSFTRQLFVLIGDKVSAEGEVIYRSTFATQIKDSNLTK